jgi:hypothetical protein
VLRNLYSQLNIRIEYSYHKRKKKRKRNKKKKFNDDDDDEEAVEKVRRREKNCKVQSFTLMAVFTDNYYSQQANRHRNPIYMYILLKKKVKFSAFK